MNIYLALVGLCIPLIMYSGESEQNLPCLVEELATPVVTNSSSLDMKECRDRCEKLGFILPMIFSTHQKDHLNTIVEHFKLVNLQLHNHVIHALKFLDSKKKWTLLYDPDIVQTNDIHSFKEGLRQETFSTIAKVRLNEKDKKLALQEENKRYKNLNDLCNIFLGANETELKTAKEYCARHKLTERLFKE